MQAVNLLQNSDSKTQTAKLCVMPLFEDKIGRAKRKPYYLTQIQTIYEDNLSDDVVYQALTQLEEEGKLRRRKARTQTQTVCFYYNSKLDKSDSNHLLNTHIKSTCKLIDKYSNHKMCTLYGEHLEQLVQSELKIQGFKIKGEHTKEYQNKKWTKTENTLDIIARHCSGKLTIGVEVKNTLSVLDKSEVEKKLEICNFLGITPVFATRWLKPYEQLVNQRKGFSWTFKEQLYPLNYEALSIKISERLQLPVRARDDLPKESVQNFHNWVKNKTL